MIKGYMYILLCGNGSYYSGSTKYLELRIKQHQNGEGANHTRKYQPVELVYFETFDRIDKAFYREKQIQGWSRAKKEALINGSPDIDAQLNELAKCLNETSHENKEASVDNNDTSAPLSVRENITTRGLSGTDNSETSTNRRLSGTDNSETSTNRGLSGTDNSETSTNRGLSGAEVRDNNNKTPF